MRHRKHTSRLNRTTEHRQALMRNLAIALITNGRIRTGQVKARVLRAFIEPLLTIAKNDSLHSRRLVHSRLTNPDAVVKLFEVLAPAAKERDGGYTRIVKADRRMGDGCPMAYIEFVDAPAVSAEPEAPAETMEKKLKRKRHEMRKARAKASA